uniref:Uncharacterized protein n=1 Tax=Plectus sambesii TaxID=2011161 RepID=A0A914XIA8_9BILA
MSQNRDETALYTSAAPAVPNDYVSPTMAAARRRTGQAGGRGSNGSLFGSRNSTTAQRSEGAGSAFRCAIERRRRSTGRALIHGYLLYVGRLSHASAAPESIDAPIVAADGPLRHIRRPQTLESALCRRRSQSVGRRCYAAQARKRDRLGRERRYATAKLTTKTSRNALQFDRRAEGL